MCGRFTLSYKADEIQLSLGITGMPDEWQPRYNIAPTQPIAAVLEGKDKKIEFLYWGLVPSWAKEISIGTKMINARSETIMEKPSYKSAFQRRRCLILADGFYEWKKSKAKGPAQPFFFQLKTREPFAFAGIWERWLPPDGSELLSGSIITCAANDVVAPIHERMPVILDKGSMWSWLEEHPAKELLNMLEPYDASKLDITMVSTLVNSPFNDSAECIRAIN
jgi:putative SOS response-associated peptidase YedK